MTWTLQNVPSQVGKTALITGVNSGIGWFTALELARAGAEVICTSRSVEKGENAIKRIKQELPKAEVRYAILDLANLQPIREFVESLSPKLKVDLLINNAGVMNIPHRKLSPDGFEMQMASNFLGPFALTWLLLPFLRRAPLPRVTTVSSGAAAMGLKRIRFEDMQWEKGYTPWKAYCQSKLADLLFMAELGRRESEQVKPLVSNAAHPGWSRTNLQSSGPERNLNSFEHFIQNRFSQNAADGALPTLMAATAASKSGDYFAPSGLFHLTGVPKLIPLPKIARDVNEARRLWGDSERLTGIMR